MKLNRYQGQFIRKSMICILAAIFLINGMPECGMAYAAERKKSESRDMELSDTGIVPMEDLDEKTGEDISLVTKQSKEAHSLKDTENPMGEEFTTDGEEDCDPCVIEAGDLSSLIKAVGEIDGDVCNTPVCESVEEDQTAGQAVPFANKRLIVKSPQGFDPYGAESIIQGYGDLFILTYATEEETQKAYEYLKTIPYLTVESDEILTTAEHEGSFGDTGNQNEAITDHIREEEKQKEIAEADGTATSLPSAEQKHAVTVAVLDTGYDFAGAPSERVASGADVSGSDSVQDGNGHGTAVSDIILRATEEDICVFPVKVADENGRSSSLRLYLGMEEALYHGASVVNISMSAYRPADGSLVAEEITKLKEHGIFVVTAAGNCGGDTADYLPANVADAIVVSAINENDEADSYSNHGSTVDYSAYGSVTAKTLGGKEENISGTSVSAAIISAVIAEEYLKNMDAGYDAIINSLNAQAKDLGDTGWDEVYGTGALYAYKIRGNAEEERTGFTGKLLNSDWKNMSDETFNEMLAGTDHMLIRYFLDKLSEEEKKELLARDTLLTHTCTNVTYDTAEKKTVGRETGTLYEYLYSQEFSEYYIQKNISDKVLKGTYYMYIRDNNFYTVALNTDKNGTKAYIKVKFHGGSGGNPFTDPKVSVSATDAGDIDFSEMTIKGVTTFTDDSGHANTIGQLDLNGIKVEKPAHSSVTGYSKSQNVAVLLGGGAAGTWSGGVTDYGSNRCSAGSTKIRLAIGYGDLEIDKKYGKKQVYTAKITKYEESGWSDWSRDTVTQNAACSHAGSKYRTHYKNCKNCEVVTHTETDTRSIPQLAHTYTYRFAKNNGIENGMRYQECSRLDAECGRSYDVNGEAWQKDVQYYQYIGCRLMDEDGNYPKDYTDVINGYCPPGTNIGECGTASWVEAAYGNAFMAASDPVESYTVEAAAKWRNIDIPRKRYHVVFQGNGATSGSMEGHTDICVGKTFTLYPNKFKRTGYHFEGWSFHKKSATDLMEDGQLVKNLSMINGETVTLYAIWQPEIYKITLDPQGADTAETAYVYETYATGYYQDEEGKSVFPGNKISIPTKSIQDDSIQGNERKQLFKGYYTGKNADGYQMIKPDGTLNANLAEKGRYRYFTSDDTVYAAWEDMYRIRFDRNLTGQDMEILSSDENGDKIENPVTEPDMQWKQKGKDLTIQYEAVSIDNQVFQRIYRLKGYSLTPEITSEDEIVLSDEKTSYRVTEDKDITLYAQWDSSFMVAYMGNKQTEGCDYLDPVENVHGNYLFSKNDKDVIEVRKDTDYFVKTVEKPTIDIATGNAEDEKGNPYMEKVPCSFLGWSLYSDAKKQMLFQRYRMENGEKDTAGIIKEAYRISKIENGKGLTFGSPAAEYGIFDALHRSRSNLMTGGDGENSVNVMFTDIGKGYLTKEEKMPYVNLYAVWDEYPQIAASDLYLPLSYAQEGRITEEYLLEYAIATDEELKSNSNTKGILKHGTDSVNETSFQVIDYQESEFLGAESDMAMSITYQAKDAAGNVTEKMVMVYLTDTVSQPYEPGYVRFISKEYEDTLAEDSIWKSGEYAETLAEVLNNYKTGEEYTMVSPLQQAFGAESVKKPGSGTWNHVEQIWHFTHEEVMAVQEYVDTNGLVGSQQGFLTEFGHCRIQ